MRVFFMPEKYNIDNIDNLSISIFLNRLVVTTYYKKIDI